MAWISAQTDYGYFLGGMALLVLSIFCFRAQTLHSRRSSELPLAPLGAFALFHALHEWSALVLATLRVGALLSYAISGGFLFLSLISLLEFGRRLGSPLIPLKSWCWRLYLPLALLSAAGLGQGLPVELCAALFLALPAAFLSLRGMMRLSARHEPRERRLLLGLGLVIALQPLGPEVWLLLSALFPAELASQGGTEVALQLLHAALALLAALLVCGCAGAAERRMLYGALFLLAMVSILAGGWSLTCFLGRVADPQIKSEHYAGTRRIPTGNAGRPKPPAQPAELVSDYRIFGIAVTCAVSVLALCCFVVLISQRESKRGAEELKRAKEEWERTFDAVPDLVAVLGRDQRIRRINLAMAQRLGLKPEEAVGSLCWQLLGCGADPSHPCPHAEMLRCGSAVSMPLYNQKLQGHFIVSSSPIPSPCGETEASVHLMRDVTEQNRLADEVNRIRNLESIGILAGGLAHDFNNVLNVVCGNVAFARMLAGASEAAAALGDAEQACERALELGRRLQVLARGGHPVREPVLLPEILRNSAQGVFKESAVRWQLSAAQELHRVEADPRQLRQVFESLLCNAREALRAGGTVTVEIGNAEVGAESALPLKAGRFVCASIRDDGRGIAADDLQRIFDPYFSTKESYHEKGMGLGLPICHAVIKRHQGHISIDSEMGRGTTVAVYLPAAA